MDENIEKEIKQLRKEFSDLQMLLFATLAELKALKVLSTVLWEKARCRDGKWTNDFRSFGIAKKGCCG